MTKSSQQWNLGIIAKDFALWVPTVALDGERLVYSMPKGESWPGPASRRLTKAEQASIKAKRADDFLQGRSDPLAHIPLELRVTDGRLSSRLKELEAAGWRTFPRQVPKSLLPDFVNLVQEDPQRTRERILRFAEAWGPLWACSVHSGCLYSPEGEGRFRPQHNPSAQLMGHALLQFDETKELFVLLAHYASIGKIPSDIVEAFANLYQKNPAPEAEKLFSLLSHYASKGKLPPDVIQAFAHSQQTIPVSEGVPSFSLPGEPGLYAVKPFLLPCAWSGGESVQEWAFWSKYIKFLLSDLDSISSVHYVNRLNRLPYGPAVHLEFIKGEKKPRLTLNPGHGFLRLIFHQLAEHLAGITEYPRCDECKELFIPERRAPKTGQRHYCPPCRDGRAANRHYMRTYNPKKSRS